MDHSQAIDIPDNRDLILDTKLLGASTEEVDKLYASTPILNQGSIGACTIFGLSGALFEATYLDEVENGGVYNQPYDPWWLWKKAKARGASDKSGWSLQGALQLALDLGLISGYARIADPGKLTQEIVDRVISSGRMIYTGSAKGNWSKIRDTHIYEESDKFLGHAYCITGSRDGHAIARNSWTESWGDHGHFSIPSDMLSRLYSSYIILDPSDVEKMRDVRNARAIAYAKRSQEKNIWNGERPDDIATSEEIRIMLSRALDILGSRSRKWWVDKLDEHIIRGKGIITIWNDKEGVRNATRDEVAAMFTRAVKRDKNAQAGTLTRWQVASVIGRDFL